MMAQDWTESAREPINHGRFINQFLPVMQLERINTKICKQKMSILFIYIYIYIYIYTHTHTELCSKA